MLKVGFIINNSDNRWLGGINYITNLINALTSDPARTIQPVLFVPKNASEDFIAGLPDVEVVRTDLVAGRSLSRIVGKAFERVFHSNPLMASLLRKHGVQLLSHSVKPGAKSPMPTIAWVPDLQHKHLPQFFSPEELEKRDQNIEIQIAQSDLVIMSSHDAQKDINSFFPKSSGKTKVLHFASLNSKYDNSIDANIKSITENYSLNSRYIHLPNQFWRHKNHTVVIDALKVLKDKDATISVVCTGQTEDYRSPGHYQELMARVSDAGLSDTFRSLGVVPYGDLKALMAGAAAVLNPSLFEGWSTTVEEAKAMGKIILLSDIPVHREQNPKRAFFFAPNDGEALADRMLEAMDAYAVADEKREREIAARELDDRVLKFSATYAEIAKEALSKRPLQ